MNTGIGEKLSSAKSDVVDFASSSYDSIKDLFGLGETPAPVAPSPAPVKLKPLSESDFTISPTMEKVLMDPFDAIGLKTLSTSDLGIDNVVDYLSSIIPTDLLDIVKGAPGLAKTLLNRAQSLDSFVAELSRKLPQNCTMGDMLRGSSIMEIYDNIDDFKNTVAELKMTVEAMPTNFTGDSLKLMSGMRAAFDTNRFSNMFSGLGNMDAFSGTKSYRYNPIGITGLTLASVNLAATNKSSTAGLFVSSGVTNSKEAISIIRKASPTEFASICAGLKLLGLARSNVLLKALRLYKAPTLKIIINSIFSKFKSGNVINPDITSLSSLENTHGDDTINAFYTRKDNIPISDFCVFINGYGVGVIDFINTSITTYDDVTSTTHFTQVSGWITLHTATVLLPLLEEVKLLGVDEYLIQYPLTPYGDILALAAATSIEYVIELTNHLLLVPLATVVIIITNITELPIGMADTILVLGRIDNEIPLFLLTLIKRIPDESFVSYTITASQYDIDLVDVIIIGINNMGLANFLKFIDHIEKVGIDQVSANVPSFIALSPESVTSISNYISYNNPLFQLEKINPSGPFLHYSVKTACGLCAKAGKALMVESMILGYSGKILDTERYQYVLDILINYSPDDDDAALGVQLAAKYFVTALFNIHPTWDITKDKDANIINMVPFITANYLAQKLLLHDDRTAVSAVIQYDNQYKL